MDVTLAGGRWLSTAHGLQGWNGACSAIFGRRLSWGVKTLKFSELSNLIFEDFDRPVDIYFEAKLIAAGNGD